MPISTHWSRGNASSSPRVQLSTGYVGLVAGGTPVDTECSWPGGRRFSCWHSRQLLSYLQAGLEASSKNAFLVPWRTSYRIPGILRWGCRGSRKKPPPEGLFEVPVAMFSPSSGRYFRRELRSTRGRRVDIVRIHGER